MLTLCRGALLFIFLALAANAEDAQPQRISLFNGQTLDGWHVTGFLPIHVGAGPRSGELATLWNAERGIGCDLHVVRCTGWKVQGKPGVTLASKRMVRRLSMTVSDGLSARSGVPLNPVFWQNTR